MNAAGPDSPAGGILFSKGLFLFWSRDRASRRASIEPPLANIARICVIAGRGYHRDESSEAKWIFTVCALSLSLSRVCPSFFFSSPLLFPLLPLLLDAGFLRVRRQFVCLRGSRCQRLYRCPSFRVFLALPFPRADELTRNSPEIARVGWKCPRWTRRDVDQEVRDLARANLIERELKSKLTTVARSRYVQLWYVFSVLITLSSVVSKLPLPITFFSIKRTCVDSVARRFFANEGTYPTRNRRFRWNLAWM